jgi:signal transduction histidine kinase/DNA-binding response OmpR family regulator
MTKIDRSAEPPGNSSESGAQALSERRAAIVDALNRSIEIFSNNDEETFNQVMTKGIRPFADTIGLDRVVFYKFMDIEGSKRLGQVYRWDKSEGGLISLTEGLEILPDHPVMKNWISITSQGGNVRLRKSDYSADVAAVLDTYGIKSILMEPIFTHGEFWGVINFQDHTSDRYFDEDCADLLRSAARIFSNAIIRAETELSVEKAIEALKRREEMANALNRAAVKFLSYSEETFGDTMTAGIKEIADTFDLDRFSIWRNIPMPELLHVSQIYRWDRESGGTTEPTKGLENVTYAKLGPRWEKVLASGETINSPARLLPEAAMLKSFGCVTAFVTPLFMNNVFWGFALLEDRHSERYFEEDSVEMMRSAAFLCANTVIRTDMEKNIREQGEQLKIRLEQQELISDLSRGFISSGDTEMLVKEAIAKLGRYHNVSLVFVFAMDYDTQDTQLVYHWCAEGNLSRNIISNLFEYIQSIFPETLPDCATIPILACDDTSTNPDAFFQALFSVGIMAVISAPLYVEGRLWGIITVEQSDMPRKWTDNEKGFVAMAASTIAGIIMRDIYNSMLQEALYKAVEASKAKGEFLSNMSHEMRTPMNAIIGMTAIGKSAQDIERKDYALDKISDASTHLLGVINDVLDMSKIEANMLELSPVEFNFEKMLQKVITVINFRIDEKQQKLVIHIDRNIPKTLIADDQRLAQIITNLIGNAVKFTPEKGSITLDARYIGEENSLYTIQISVTDTGIGISSEQQKRLFNSFQQAETSTTRKYGGTGLGLAISKSIVEMMGGKIWIKSEPGKGSTFAFTIQARCGDADNQRLLAADVNWNNIRIMAVDDDPDILTYFHDMAQDFGVLCETASGGKEALALIKQKGGCHIYFVDWKMPGMDGIQLAHEIKAHTPKNTVVIMISAAEWSAIAEEAKKAGVDKFLSKPLFSSVIADIINECLGANQQQAEKAQVNINGLFAGRCILLAEDVEINREIVLSLLEPTQIEIDCAENGKEAVRMFCDAPDKYELIFMDVQMPEMDGYEATRLIRSFEAERSSASKANDGMEFPEETPNELSERPKRVPIIAMTANVFREDIERCIHIGMDSHIGKPLDFYDLLEKLNTYLSPQNG